MTRCALSFQNKTKLSNNHSEMSKLNFNQLSHFFFNCRILTTDPNCTFSSKKCFLSAAWSNVKVRVLNVSFYWNLGWKHDYKKPMTISPKTWSLWTRTPPIHWDTLGTNCDALHPLWSRCAGWWRSHMPDRQHSSALTKALFSSVNHLFVNLFKEWI